jgi:WD40 repeat protein
MSTKKILWSALLAAGTMLPGQAPPPTQGVPYLRLVWARIADLNGELGSVECAEFSADGRLLATATKYSNDISVWRVSDGFQVWSAKADQEVERVAFSPAGGLLAAGGEDDQLRLFRVADGKLERTLKHNSGIDSLRFSPDGSLLATGEEDGIVRLWSMPEGRQVGEAKIEGAVNELDFTRDGKLLVAAGDPSGLRIYETKEMRVIRIMQRNQSAPTITTRFSPDGKLVAAAGADGHVVVWDASSGDVVRRLNFTGQKVETLTFSPDGLHLVYAGHDPHIRVVRVSDWALVHHSQPVDNAEYVAFSTNGSFVASAHQDGAVRLWVWMRGDAGLNKRLHEALMKQQAEEDARKAAPRAPAR